jgi:hypothetical protein
MTPIEWLEKHNKKPWCLDPYWYWGTELDYDPNDADNEPDEIDFLIPDPIFQRLSKYTTYPNVKMYRTKDEALEDFNQAFTSSI